jgi:hypothetical protein
MVKVKIAITLGIRIKNARVYFQLSMKKDRSEMSETPKEKAN